jgi:2-keto-4-pentenoate hydratase/2-oxohepta-3-ene-1,7-dioic acid hydratase in catechol pathway
MSEGQTLMPGDVLATGTVRTIYRASRDMQITNVVEAGRCWDWKETACLPQLWRHRDRIGNRSRDTD